MSKSPRDHSATDVKRSLSWMIMAPGVIIIFILMYVGGYFVFPSTIQSAYQEDNCETVLSRANMYAGVFPFATSQNDLFEVVQECALYTLALMHENESAWRDAYHTFAVYSESYPNGRFRGDVHERTASILMRLAQEQITEKKYAEALQNIDLVLSDFSDTDAARQAAGLKPDLYMHWGVDLREAGNYAEAERIFQEVHQLAAPGAVTSSQLELSQTYLAWGMDLGSQKNFAEASMKFDLAASTDPGGGPSGEVQAGLKNLYTQWGDYLVERGDYGNAMGQYEIAAALTRDSDPMTASEIIATGYLHWAAALITDEDFLGALVLLDLAEAAAAGDETRALVDTARSNLYLAFSQSDGEQAQKAMHDAAKSVCRHHVAPRLPIFGLDAEHVGAVVEGATGELPANIAATTPASLHYVVCIEEKTKVVGSTSRRLYATEAGFLQYLFERLQYSWTIALRNMDTGDEAATTIIDGGDPPQFPAAEWDYYVAARSGSTQYFGPIPEFADLVTWLSLEIK
jgi:tetratricopeptide (TPR) repeat protein